MTGPDATPLTPRELAILGELCATLESKIYISARTARAVAKAKANVARGRATRADLERVTSARDHERRGLPMPAHPRVSWKAIGSGLIATIGLITGVFGWFGVTPAEVGDVCSASTFRAVSIVALFAVLAGVLAASKR